MPVENVNTSAGIDPKYLQKTTKKTQGNAEMGKDAFLNLLVTQLKYQDPLSPTNDKEFIAQMAQFSSLEQMQNLNTTSSKMMGYSLMNKSVTAEVTNQTTQEKKMVEGIVEGITVDAGKTYLKIDGSNVNIDDVKTVSEIATVQILSQMNTINKSINDLKTEMQKLKNPTTTPTVEK